jgi:DNA gyrase/topoisomerase IV subunit B
MSDTEQDFPFIFETKKPVLKVVPQKEMKKPITASKPNIHGIEKLSDYTHIRLRTNMYFGSCDPHTQTVINYNNGKPIIEEQTWVPALYTSFREILDNASDELIGHGFGNRIDITYDEKELIFSVEDNGRGIPIDYDTTHKQYLATMVLSEPRAGRNFGERGEVAGTNGIGSSATAITSEWFEFEIHRDNKKFVQRFQEGNIVDPRLQVTKPKITDVRSEKTGTFIKYRPSKEVFQHRILPESFVKSRVMEFAINNPNIKVYYNGEHLKVKPKPEQTLFPDLKPISIEVNEEGFKSKFWIIPNFVESGDHAHTIVNNIPAFNGGVHIETFKRVFFANLLNGLERESKKRKLSPNRSDITEGTLIYNITNMKAPNFDSQSKTRLINEDVAQILKRFLDNEDFYKDVIKKNKEWIDQIYQRCSDRTQKKDAGEIAKLAKKVLRNKVPRLMDATGNNRHACIIFIAEGDSAIGGISSVRNPEIHGGLGLRGKVMNVNGESPKKVLDNQALTDIMNSLGLIIGQKARRAELRYGKVYIATDADPDGYNIAALLMNFFHSYWPELFDPKMEPFVYIFQTPFIIAEKGKVRKYWYAHNYHEFDSTNWSGWAITRAKGLGTLTEEDWTHSIQNPVAIPIVDDGKMTEALDLIFSGKRADDRKSWIGL